MANLTITVDPETLKKARIKAIQEGTSVNKVLGEYLTVYIGEAVRGSETGDPPTKERSPELAPRQPFVFDPGTVADRQERREDLERLFALAKEAGVRSGGITWTREDLYDRENREAASRDYRDDPAS